MRITFVLPHAPLAGGTRVALIYAKAFREMGHSVRIVTRPPRRLTVRNRLRKLLKGKPPGFAVTAYDPFAEFGSDHIVADYRKTDFAAHVPDADVVIATWWETAYAVMRLPRQKGRKIYFVQHHEAHDHLPVHITTGSYYLPMQKVTIAGWLRNTMRELYGDSDVPVIHNSVDHEQFSSPIRLRQAVPTVGFMYSKMAHKGPDIAAEAITRARRSIPDLRVVAFGTAAARPGRDLPEGTRYFEQPPQDRLREIYAMCDGWLMPSRSEGFALPVLEAMACRTPVISTRTGIGPDILETGTNGYLVDTDDADGMAKSIVALMSLEQASWSRMSAAAHATTTSWTWQDAARDFEAVLLNDTERLRGAG